MALGLGAVRLDAVCLKAEQPSLEHWGDVSALYDSFQKESTGSNKALLSHARTPARAIYLPTKEMLKC